MDISELKGKTFDELFDGVLESFASSANFTSGKVQFGKCYLYPILKVRDNPNSPYRVVEKKEYNAYGDQNRLKEIGIQVDIQEFSQRAAENDWSYSRKVSTYGPDWEKFKESFLSVMAEIPEFKDKIADMRKNVMPYLSYLHDKYVEMDDVPQSKQSSDGKVYKTPVLVKVYTNREECYQAYKTRFKIEDGVEVVAEQAQTSDSSANYPEGWDDESWQAVSIEIKSMKSAGKSAAGIAKDYGISVAWVMKALK